jgi:hypothetical protein
VARAIPRIVAVPDGLPLGCQRESLYFPLSCAKEGGWADAGVPTRIAKASKSDLKKRLCAKQDRPGEPHILRLFSFVAILTSYPLSPATAERVAALPEAVMHKRLILLLGVLLGSYVPVRGQTLTPQMVSAPDRIAPFMAIVRTLPAQSLAPSFPLSETPGKSAARSTYVFARAYRDDQGLEGLKSLSQIREVKTLFLTQSILPLVQLWGGRLRLDGFMSRVHMQNVQLGPSGGGGLLDFRPPRQWYPGGPRSIGLSGISLSFHFGRDAQMGRPTQIWQRLARIHGVVR